MKQLARYKEAKELQKEKEKREKERKGVFKVGLYHQQASQPFCPLPPVSAATSRTKVRMSCESSMYSKSTKWLFSSSSVHTHTLQESYTVVLSSDFISLTVWFLSQ